MSEMESVFKERVEVPPCVCEVSAVLFPRFLFLMKDLEANFEVLLRDLKEEFFVPVLPAELLASEPAPPPWAGL